MKSEKQQPDLRLEKARSVSLESSTWFQEAVLVRITFELLASMASVFDGNVRYTGQKVVGLFLWTLVLAGLIWGYRAAIGRGEACDVCRLFGA